MSEVPLYRQVPVEMMTSYVATPPPPSTTSLPSSLLHVRIPGHVTKHRSSPSTSEFPTELPAHMLQGQDFPAGRESLVYRFANTTASRQREKLDDTSGH